MFTPIKRVGAQRVAAWNAVTALKREQQYQSSHNLDEDLASETQNTLNTNGGQFFRNDGAFWRTDAFQIHPQIFNGVVPYLLNENSQFISQNPQIPTQQNFISQNPVLDNTVLENSTLENPVLDNTVLENSSLENPVLKNPVFGNPVVENEAVVAAELSKRPPMESFDDQPFANMEAFLQELEEEDSCHSNEAQFPEGHLFQKSENPGLSFEDDWTPTQHGEFVKWPFIDSSKTIEHFHSLSFDSMHQSAALHLWTIGPVPEMTIFYLFRKVYNKEQADRAVGVLMKDRETRLSRGLTTPYSEFVSSAVFNALNRTGGEELVAGAAEKALTLGLSLSRSNMYHLMKQYSIQGKVEHVERLFRALEYSGKSWNSNCVVIMMLAYFNRGKFEEADQLRHELKSRGIKISERIENRLEALLRGEEKWRWEDQVYYRNKPMLPPPGFAPIRDSISPLLGYPSTLPRVTFSLNSPHLYRSFHSQGAELDPRQGQESEEGEISVQELPKPTLLDAIKEPRIHLTILRAAGFEDLLPELTQFVKTEGPVENVCISFLFRKVETREEVEKAMEFLEEERRARTEAGIKEEYNETTCSRIFTALFRTGASELAFNYAKRASDTGLVLSGKALHELLKSFATRNEVEKVEQIWSLVKVNSKPSSRIVYSIFRTYFDNGMMDRAQKYKEEIEGMGIKLSASATRNIDDVLSGVKQWVKDPNSSEF